MSLRLCRVLIGVLIPVPASANEFKADFRSGVDTTILDISTGGLWEQGARYGTMTSKGSMESSWEVRGN